jgi:glycosyltransferase involved in cell wall biosynthesis
MIHMGVSIPETLPPIANRGGRLAIVVPANLIDVKGHRYLIDAIGRLDPQKRERIKCRFFGDGHLKQKLVRQVKLRGLRDCIEFCGAAPHNSIMEIYEKGQADVIILPSINTNDGSHEGIPVSLMEAMAYGVLAVSTNTGGIAELLGGGAGIIVPEKDAAALGRTIGDIIDGKIDIETIRKAGMAKVDCEFNSRKNAAQLMKLITAREKQ